MTLTPCWTAYWIAWRKPDSVVSLFSLNTFSASTFAPGAAPTILIQQPLAGKRAACPGIDPLGEVVLWITLRRDRADVDEHLPAAGRTSRRVTREVDSWTTGGPGRP